MIRLISLAPPPNRESAIERAVIIANAIGSKGMVNEARVREVAARAWDRNPSYDGIARQAKAVAASKDRTRTLQSLSVPALVIDGEADRSSR